MWIAKFILKHNCMLGNRCKKYQVTLQSVMLSTLKKGGKIYTYSMHLMQGPNQNKKKFMKDLKKDENVIELEHTKDVFFLVEKQKSKAGAEYTGDILFIKPVLIDIEGIEHWEVASPKKEPLMNYINKTKGNMDMFELMKIQKENISNIFFPKLFPEITQLQKEILETAINQGYYEIPKKIDIRKLAKIKGISHSTFQEHLKKAEKKLIPSLIDYTK